MAKGRPHIIPEPNDTVGSVVFLRLIITGYSACLRGIHYTGISLHGVNKNK